MTGPPVAAGFKADGTPTPAAAGFASKQGVEVSALERVETPKGVYLAYRRRQRGKATVDVLPDVLGGTLRALTFPKLMHWDAMLEDGKGDLLFGRPIRWMLFLYGGRVVPFTIGRTPAAQTGAVQDVTTGAATYGHRFLTTSGRAGRAIKVRSFDEYRAGCSRTSSSSSASERHDGSPASWTPRPAAAGPREPQRAPRGGAAAGGARPGRVPVGDRRHVRAGVPRSCRTKC